MNELWPKGHSHHGGGPEIVFMRMGRLDGSACTPPSKHKLRIIKKRKEKLDEEMCYGNLEP